MQATLLHLTPMEIGPTLATLLAGVLIGLFVALRVLRRRRSQ